MLFVMVAQYNGLYYAGWTHGIYQKICKKNKLFEMRHCPWNYFCMCYRSLWH